MLDIRNIDCMKMMAEFPDKHFDLAIIDPPYKDETKGLTAGINREHFKYEYFKQPSDEYFAELMRVSKHQVIWGFNYFLEKLKNTDACIFWNKHQNGHFAEGELAWCSLGKTRYFNRPYQKDAGNYKIHPTQKPVELYEFILHHYAEKGWKILDTHLGSGSSAIACYKNGFDLTASEIDIEYYEKAMKRIEELTAQTFLF